MANCPHCKAPLAKADAANCAHCGTALTAPRPAAEPAAGGGLGGFLRDNWVWIVAPVVFAVVLVVVLALVFGGDGSSPFVYSIW